MGTVASLISLAAWLGKFKFLLGCWSYLSPACMWDTLNKEPFLRFFEPAMIQASVKPSRNGARDEALPTAHPLVQCPGGKSLSDGWAKGQGRAAASRKENSTGTGEVPKPH